MEKSKFSLEQMKYQDQHIKNQWDIENIKSEMHKREVDETVAMLKQNGTLDEDGKRIYVVGQGYVNPDKNAGIGSGSFYKGLGDLETQKNQNFAEIVNGIGITYNGQTIKDLFKLDENGQYILNNKYVAADGSVPIYNEAKRQMGANIQALLDVRTKGTVNPNFAKKIEDWASLVTQIQRTKEVASEKEAKYQPAIDALGKNLPNNYNVSFYNKEGMFMDTLENRTLTKGQLIDIALFTKGSNLIEKNSDLSDQALQRLKKSLGMQGNSDDDVKNYIYKIQAGMGNLGNTYKDPNGSTYNANQAYQHILGGLDNPNVARSLQKREEDFRDLQRQNLGNTVNVVAEDKKDTEPIRKGLIEEVHSYVGDKSGGGWKTALDLLEKPGKEPDVLDNNQYTFKYDENSGKWFANISRDVDGKMKEVGIDIPLSAGFIKDNNLNKQLDPGIIKLNHSIFGKMLNLNAGNSTTSAVINSAEAYTTALDRSNIGNFSVGYQLTSFDRSNTSYIPHLYIYDKSTGKYYNDISLDWTKLAKLKETPLSDKQKLLNKNSIYSESNIVDAIDNFKEYVNTFKDPNIAIKALIGNYDNK
jgi:hypothetical protein